MKANSVLMERDNERQLQQKREGRMCVSACEGELVAGSQSTRALRSDSTVVSCEYGCLYGG